MIVYHFGRIKLLLNDEMVKITMIEAYELLDAIKEILDGVYDNSYYQPLIAGYGFILLSKEVIFLETETQRRVIWGEYTVGKELRKLYEQLEKAIERMENDND